MSPFPGLSIGHATDTALKSGVTVFLPDAPAIAAVHVAGGAPASREAAALSPENSVERVDAIVLTGGSAFGLAAADGAMDWLAAHGRGFAVGPVRVPIVAAAALFDLLNGGEKPADLATAYRTLARTACEAAGSEVAIGSVGAGTGATTADLKGGFGAAETVLPDGSRVAAFVAVNAVGRVTLGTTPHFRAAPFEREAEFGGLGFPAVLPPDAGAVVTKRPMEPAANTTIALIATDCALSRAEAKRLAITAHDGIALGVFPAHTPFDGDTVFALATGTRAFSGGVQALGPLSAAAPATLARAIARAVFAATPAPNDRFPTWRERYLKG
jgi:L-aminopeptidase/D-esterase-like protein